MNRGIVFFLLILIFMLSSCKNADNQNNVVKEVLKENKPSHTSEPIEVPGISVLSNLDSAIKEAIEQYFEKDITALTDEDYKKMAQFDYLVIKDIASSFNDIEKFFPNIKYLHVSVDTLSPELYKSIKNLDSLKALTLYCNSITVTEFDNDFEYFEIAYSDSDSLPSNNILSQFSIADEPFLRNYLKGNIQKIVTVNDNGTMYELISTDYYTDGERWEMQERFVFLYENDSFIFKEALDASSEIDSEPRNNLQLIDINFDGILDILVDNGHFGAEGAVAYTCFINNKDSYIKYDSFSNIPNPAIDTENKKILSTWRNSAASHSWAMFTLQNNEFIMTDCLTSIAEESSENDWIYIVEKLIDGKLQETEKFSTIDYSDEEINNIIYDKNSYWELLSKKWINLYIERTMIGFSGFYSDNKINATIQRIISEPEEISTPKELTLTKEIYLTQTDETNNQKNSFDDIVYDTVSCGPLLDESAKSDIVYKYLKAQNMYKEKPDGITYRQNKPYIEYYIDKQNNKMSFVIHIWDEYLTIQESKTTVFADTIICTTLHTDELTKQGILTSTYTQDGDVISKQLKDIYNEEIAYYEYQYTSGMPFPLITSERLKAGDKATMDLLLELFHEYWLYKEKAIFNDDGKLTKYDGNIYQQGNVSGSFQCLYNENDMIEKIEEPLSGEDLEQKELSDDLMFSSEVNINYDEDKKLKYLDYWRSPINYGIWQSSGTKHYDEQQRLIYSTYYVTHGSHSRFYLYKDNKPEPWIYIEFCSMPYSGSGTEEISYGHEVSFVLLQPL